MLSASLLAAALRWITPFAAWQAAPVHVYCLTARGESLHPVLDADELVNLWSI